MEQVKKCNLCGSDTQVASRFLFSAPERNFGKETFNLVKCKICGLVYINPRPTSDEIKNYYPPDYHSRPLRCTASDIENTAVWGVPWKEAFRIKASPVIKCHPAPGRILDIGSSDGSLLKYLESKNWEVWGIEPQESAARFAIETLGLKNVTCGTAEMIDTLYEENFFDVITLFHVLEHLSDPFSALIKIKRCLKTADGILVIEIPNFDSFESRIFGKAWVGISAPLHLYHFTPSTIKKMLLKAGYEITELEFNVESGVKYVANYSESVRFMLEDMGLRKKRHHITPADSAASDGTKKKSVFFKTAETIKTMERLVFLAMENITAALRIGPYIRIFAKIR